MKLPSVLTCFLVVHVVLALDDGDLPTAELKTAKELPSVSPEANGPEARSYKSSSGASKPDDAARGSTTPLEPSVAAAIESAQSREDDYFISAVTRFFVDILRWLYDIVTYDFCTASSESPSQPKSLSLQDDAGSSEAYGTTLAMSDDASSRRSQRWKFWKKRRPPCPDDGVVNRLSCYMRRARTGMFQRKEEIFARSALCETLCLSCLCDFDPTSPCGVQLDAWRQKTSPVLYKIYIALHYSRLLCLCAVVQTALCDFLRKKYIYKVVICMPLLILFLMLCKALLTLVHLRKYLENTRTPSAYTAECSYHHSEDEDLRSTADKKRATSSTAVPKHHSNHMEVHINKLNSTLASLRNFSAFVETTRGYYKSKIDAELRLLLEAAFKVTGAKAYLSKDGAYELWH